MKFFGKQKGEMCHGLKHGDKYTICMKQEIQKATLFELLLCLIGRRTRMRVKGSSLWPVLKEGDIIFMQPMAYVKKAIVRGDMVVARHPYKKSVVMVKYVTDISSHGISLEGLERKDSEDSRSFGRIKTKLLVGLVRSVKKRSNHR